MNSLDEVKLLLPSTSLASAEPRHTGLNCRVCEWPFSGAGDHTPRLLNCGHTLCHACLQQLLRLEDSVIYCPFDRQANHVGNGGVFSLRKNFALVELIEDQRAQDSRAGASADSRLANLTRPAHQPGHEPAGEIDFVKEMQLGIPCDELESHLAVIFCVVCESHLCLECEKATHNSKVLGRHRRVPISQKPQQKQKCFYHSAYAVEFVCLDEACAADSPLMCLLCRDYGRHRQHLHALLDTEAKSFRAKVSGTVNCLHGFSAEVADTLRQIGDTVEGIEGNAVSHGSADAARHQIRHHFGRLREQIANQETAALVVIDSYAHDRVSGLRQRQEDLVAMLSHLSVIAQQLEKSLPQEDTKLMLGRRETQLLLDAVNSQKQQFVDLPSQLNLDSVIPISFTKDNRVHIGPKIEMRVVTLGLDRAGKTTILFKLKHNEVIQTIPTIGFNVETVEYKNLRLTIWDVGGVPKLRPLWHHYYSNTQALIFVLDSSDCDRLMEVQGELVKLLSERELRDAALLIYANKQDVDEAMCVESIAEELSLAKLCYGRCWHIQGSTATTGDGLHEGLDWLARQLVSAAANTSNNNDQ